MTAATLASALEREHHAIDAGIVAFLARQEVRQAGAEPLVRAIAALRRHIFLEEELLFPPLRDAGLVAPVLVMLREHGEIWGTLDALEAQLETGSGRAAIDELCEQLVAQLKAHNAKEEPVLYPQADDVLGESAAAQLEAFLAAGKLPAGWTCAQARSG